MKKLLAVLLALCVVGGFAFAQGKVAVALDGTFTLIDQDLNASAAYRNNTYATKLRFTGANADNTMGLQVQVTHPKALAAISYTNFSAWFKMFNNVAKFTFGNFTNAGWESMAAITGNYDMGYVVGGNKLQAALYPVAGLTLVADLPIDTTAQSFVHVMKTTNLFASYAIADIGTLRAWCLLENGNAGGDFNFTGVENLDTTVSFNYSSASIDFAVWGSYALGSFTPMLEFIGGLAGSTFTWAVAFEGDYTFNDNISAGLIATFDSASAYSVDVYGAYAFGNGVSIGADVAYDGTDLTWSVPVKFSVAF